MLTLRLSLFPKSDSHLRLRLFKEDDPQPLCDVSAERQTLAQLLEDADGHYRRSGIALDQLGRRLFNYLEQHLRLSSYFNQPLALRIESDDQLRHLPWELLHDGQHFWNNHPLHRFTPLRTAHQCETRADTRPPANRPLRVLFMAASPEDVHPVLDFEAEEAHILKTGDRAGIELHVEESGSLEGLRDTVEAHPDDNFDVVHITGHADVRNNEPIFWLESETGRRKAATADQLANVFRPSGRFPRLMFLSGCRTAQSADQGHIRSLAEALVQRGAGRCLGWALPVGDGDASSAAAYFYGQLANGSAIDQALAHARQQLDEHGSRYWHMLRLYSDASPAAPLVTPPRTKDRQPRRPISTQSAFVEANNRRIEICARENFVGRRRLLQRCLRSLRPWPDDPDYCHGVLLHGMGGLGKTSAAVRLADRLQSSHNAIVWHGGIDETELIRVLSDKLRSDTATDILNQVRQPLAHRLTTLFEQLETPLLLIFDDFEQNAPHRTKGDTTYTPTALEVLTAVMNAVQKANSDCRLIVTCRFDIPLPAPLRWFKAMPETLRDADLAKKLQQLPAYEAREDVGKRAKRLAAGNPRLLEWLHQLLERDDLELNPLLDALTQKEARFRENILAQALLDQQPSAVRQALALTALYHIPVNAAAIAALSEQDPLPALATAAGIGLVEIETTGAEHHYFVSALLHTLLETELTPQQTQQALKTATVHFHQLKQRSDNQERELLRLALTAGERDIAIEITLNLALQAYNQNRYLEAEQLCHETLAPLGEDFRLLATLARTEMILGRSDAAQHFEHAMTLCPPPRPDTPKPLLADIAAANFQYSELLIRNGKLSDALVLLQETVLPLFESLGDVRSRAVTMGKIADILQARGQLDEALRIRHEEELPIYESLGDVQSLLVGKTNLALLLLKRDTQHHRHEAEQLLCWSLNAARQMGIPEAEVILRILDEHNMRCNV